MSGKTLIDPYFVDFVCRERKVVIEVDGGTHGTENEIVRDRARTRELQRLGYRVFRVHNIDVYENIDRVLDALLAFVEDAQDAAVEHAAAPHPDPLPASGEREN